MEAIWKEFEEKLSAEVGDDDKNSVSNSESNSAVECTSFDPDCIPTQFTIPLEPNSIPTSLSFPGSQPNDIPLFTGGCGGQVGDGLNWSDFILHCVEGGLNMC